MTPPHPPLDAGPLDDGPLDDDTLAVHAVVDDDATAAQRRLVARRPELVARVAEIRAAVEAVATPVDPPPADDLAALRRRALDGRDEPAGDPTGPEEEPEPAPPVRELAADRPRAARRLPPLPAVAAVVVLLVVVGVGLLVAGTTGDGEDAADRSSAQTEAGVDAGEDGAREDGAGDAAAATDDTDESLADRPADELRDDLLARATARYATQADLEAELRQVDVTTLALAGSPPAAAAPEGDASSAPATTTAPDPDTAHAAGRNAFAFAADPVVTRCDDVLRAAEPDLGPAVAAVLAEVDGIPVLVLSNPTETTDRAPNGVRLTVLNAVDCSPRAAVLR